MTVYAVLAHGDPSTLSITARALAPNPVIVHVDAKSSDTAYPRANNITYVKQRVNVKWGGFSVVRATENLYRVALQHCNSTAEYVVLLSGQCVPIRPPQALDDLFAASPGAQYCQGGLLLDGHAINENRIRQSWQFDRFDARHIGIRGRVMAARRNAARIATRSKPASLFNGLTMVAGSQWTAFSAGVLTQMMSDLDRRTRLSRLLSDALAPDEIFFHSLLYSSREELGIPLAPLRGKGERRTADFANLHHIDRSLTKYLSGADLLALPASNKFFARKVRDGSAGALSDAVGSLTSRDRAL